MAVETLRARFCIARLRPLCSYTAIGLPLGFNPYPDVEAVPAQDQGLVVHLSAAPNQRVAVASDWMKWTPGTKRNLAIRTLLSDHPPVNGKEFIERVTDLGRRRSVPVRVDAKRGKGSHVILYYGDRKTVVKDRRKDIGPGLLSAMTRQLGLDPDDLR